MTQPGIVFVHGLRRDPSIWDPFRQRAELLGARTMAPTLPGHASRWSERFTRESAVETVAGAVEALATDGPVLLVGHSLGGFTSLAYAAQDPAPLGSLVLSACLSDPRGKPVRLYGDVGRWIADTAVRARSIVTPGGKRTVLPPVGAPLPDHSNHASTARRAESGWDLVHDALSAYAGWDAVEALHHVHVPVSMMVGQWDPMRIDARRFHAARPEAPLTVLPRVGHDSFEQDPEAFWEVVLQAWLRLKARTLMPLAAAR